MSSLRTVEKAQLEGLLRMGGGYVLDFTNQSFHEFMADNAGVDIYAERYATNGDSKARRLRAFWTREPDALVGRVLSALLEYWEFSNPEPTEKEYTLAISCQQIARRLLGDETPTAEEPEREFLDTDWSGVSLQRAVEDPVLLGILQSRLAEAERCVANRAPLAAIFLCGSILEGLLLSAARANPAQFTDAPTSPKDPKTGKVRPFQEWRLAELIDVACQVGCLTVDVKKFSHAMRDFRNYIHPYQQMSANFSPDSHTARLCLQALKAAIACLSGERE